MKRAVITGAAGFAGFSTTKELLDRGYEVYAIVRPSSPHNERLTGLSDNLKYIELDCSDFEKIPDFIPEKCDCFYHLAWFGGRHDLEEQRRNIDCFLKALRSASKIGCTRFVGIGSQAEIGLTDKVMDEEIALNPINAYGAAKAAALHLSKILAGQLSIEWTWGRIFSLYGDNEPEGRMLPDLIHKLGNDLDISLSSCEQNWDYLHVRDGAKAIVSIGEKGHPGEIYNIANGDYKPLKNFVEEAKSQFDYKGKIIYGDKADPFVSLQPDMSKLKEHTGWKPEISFEEGIHTFQ